MSISIDVGGTFTDFVIIDRDVRHFKISSTPSNPENAISEGIKGMKVSGDVFHGTTVATNAFLEKEGVKTAFITNEGFEDILFIGRQERPNLYDFTVSKPKPPLEEKYCFGIDCRTKADGKIEKKVDEESVLDILQEIDDEELSFAVCLLHSYKNPEQEKYIGDILEREGYHYSLSSDVSREFREYERGMTTLLDAYLNPLINDYFASLNKILGKEPYIMKSSGGLEKSSSIKAADTFYSGPAGGVAGAEFLSSLTGIDNIVTFDMGGTSADMASIVGGEISWKDEGEIGDFPVQSRMVDIVTVGSGGGSIARKDEGGVLRVGPKSAGAEPGPICYGRGGEKPTVTDALLMMKYIDPEYFLGGDMDLKVDKTREKIKELSYELSLSFDETLHGIYRVVNSKMARTMKGITVERGLKPEDFAILAFGGAGPLHAAALAEELEMKKVIVPPLPGVFSALGMVTGDVVHDYHRTLITSLENGEVLEEAIEELKKEAMEGETNVLLGLRYKGQSYHLNIPYDEKIENRFHKMHKEKYGYANTDAPVEVVRVHLEVRKKKSVENFPGPGEEEHPAKKRECLFVDGWTESKVYYRDWIKPGMKGVGPTIIEDKNSTILTPPGWEWSVDEYGIIHMDVIE
ncbi:MAG: hydantoinase/oxoprolinase family protein [Thermoplasmata archaeon]